MKQFKKIDLYYRKSNGEVIYLNSTTSFKTEFKTNHICLGTLQNELEYEKYVSEIISSQNEISLSVVSRYVDGKINKEIIYQ